MAYSGANQLTGLEASSTTLEPVFSHPSVNAFNFLDARFWMAFRLPGRVSQTRCS
jgi:hypothetical protein